MNVGVYYLAQLRHSAGCSTEQVALPGSCTVAELVEQLAQRHTGLRNVLFDAEGRIQPTILIFRGEDRVGFTTLLHDRDEVTLMTPIAGGA
jgi:molybdopterin converting factor small subunit